MGTHAASTATALEQLEMFAQVQLRGSAQSLGSLLAHAVQVVVHVDVGIDGSRRVHNISAVIGARDKVLEVRTLYTFDGNFRATEHRSGFLGG